MKRCAALIVVFMLPLIVKLIPAGSAGLGPGFLLGPPSALASSNQSRARLLSEQDAPAVVESSSRSSTKGAAGEEASPREPAPKPVKNGQGYLENGWLIWEELMPEGWDPAAIFEELNINDMADDDPRVEEVIERFLKKWAESPVNPAIDGKRFKIPGFVVPLDFEKDKIDEFFLVPFFGACIHVPPPPPNQIIMVRLPKAMEGLAAMEVVWVYGQLDVEKVSTDMGSSGYSLAADEVEFYKMEDEAY
ncbi:MAG: DUF3299 domain-containing protein [Deltaproteobacteria bacterium]|jgi:hypothetical protein|nr:DUF3299 domain-containing protein [Deltaproteobacteria bacterium]